MIVKMKQDTEVWGKGRQQGPMLRRPWAGIQELRVEEKQKDVLVWGEDAREFQAEFYFSD